jgi:hypothetical protein
MFNGENLMVDQLVKVIESIQIGRKTGSLVATRGEGASYEAGTVVFVNGRVVQAKVGRRSDREALNWLSTWSRCRYNFVLPTGTEVTTVPKEMAWEGQTTTGNLTTNAAVPKRSKPLGHGLRVLSENKMSRMHRHVFLLVDGIYKITDLMRMLALDEYQVQALLYDLADLGIISVPSPLFS